MSLTNLRPHPCIDYCLYIADSSRQLSDTDESMYIILNTGKPIMRSLPRNSVIGYQTLVIWLKNYWKLHWATNYLYSIWEIEYWCVSQFFSSPEPKLRVSLYDRTRAGVSVRASVCAFLLSNMNISETSLPIVIEFHLEHHWGGGLAALGFGLDRTRTLVSMPTDSSHKVIIGKTLWPL